MSQHVFCTKNTYPAVYVSSATLISLQNSSQMLLSTCMQTRIQLSLNTLISDTISPSTGDQCVKTVAVIGVLSACLCSFVLHFFMFCLSLRLAVLAGQVTRPRTLSGESDPVGSGLACAVVGIALDCQHTFTATRKYTFQ